MNRTSDIKPQMLPDRETEERAIERRSMDILTKITNLAGTTAKLLEENQIPRYSDSPTRK